jgi:hypothetical protein
MVQMTDRRSRVDSRLVQGLRQLAAVHQHAPGRPALSTAQFAISTHCVWLDIRVDRRPPLIEREVGSGHELPQASNSELLSCTALLTMLTMTFTSKLKAVKGRKARDRNLDEQLDRECETDVRMIVLQVGIANSVNTNTDWCRLQTLWQELTSSIEYGFRIALFGQPPGQRWRCLQAFAAHDGPALSLLSASVGGKVAQWDLC